MVAVRSRRPRLESARFRRAIRKRHAPLFVVETVAKVSRGTTGAGVLTVGTPRSESHGCVGDMDISYSRSGSGARTARIGHAGQDRRGDFGLVAAVFRKRAPRTGGHLSFAWFYLSSESLPIRSRRPAEPWRWAAGGRVGRVRPAGSHPRYHASPGVHHGSRCTSLHREPCHSPQHSHAGCSERKQVSR